MQVDDALVSSENHDPLQSPLFHAKIFEQPLTLPSPNKTEPVVLRGHAGRPRSMDEYILLFGDFFGI